MIYVWTLPSVIPQRGEVGLRLPGHLKRPVGGAFLELQLYLPAVTLVATRCCTCLQRCPVTLRCPLIAHVTLFAILVVVFQLIHSFIAVMCLTITWLRWLVGWILVS